MKLWIDDIRQAPEGYVWMVTVDSAKNWIVFCEDMAAEHRTINGADAKSYFDIDVIDMDHDAGDYTFGGGDYIKLLDWLEETGRDYPIHIHSMNPVGVQNMRAIIERNHWEEIK